MRKARSRARSHKPRAENAEPIGLIGLGIMGSAMAASVMRDGYPLAAHVKRVFADLVERS